MAVEQVARVRDLDGNHIRIPVLDDEGLVPAGILPAVEPPTAEIDAAVTAHEAEANPHPVYETSAEAQAKVDAAVAALVNSAPSALNTLKELSDALGADANYAATITTALAGKQPLDSDLTAIAALSTTSFGRSLLAAADAAALRTLAEITAGFTNPMTTAGDILYEGGGVDQALGNFSSASSGSSGHEGNYAVDGDDATYFHPSNGDNTAWIRVDLGAAKTIAGYRVKQSQAQLTKVQWSADGSTGWTDAATTPSATDSGSSTAFAAAATARWWRVLLVGFYDIYVFSLFDAVVPARLAKGTLGYLLTQGAAAPAWLSPAAALASYVPAAHGTRLTRSANQSVGNNALTAVSFTVENYDTDAMHEGVTNPTRVTIPVIAGVTTGLWAIKAAVYTDQSNADLQILLNGTTPIGFTRNTNPAEIGAAAVSADWVMTAGDYVELLCRTPSGAGNVVFDGGVSPMFSVAFLGKVT